MKIKTFVVISNVVFLLPFVLAVREKLFLLAFAIGAAFLDSFLFHSVRTTALRTIDRASAGILFGVSVLLLMNSPVSSQFFWFAIGCGVIGISLFILHVDRPHDVRHGFWHVFSGLAVYFCIRAFVGY